jgi:sugar phosphate isomerase/epimerase
MISLSTAWCPPKYGNMAKLLAAGRKMGFEAFELGVNGFPFDAEAVLNAIARDGIHISSIHAVCSRGEVPTANMRGDWIGEADEKLRTLGVALVKETIDIARLVKAPAVVLHGGTLPMPDVRTTQTALYRLASLSSDELEDVPAVREFIEERGKIVEPYLDALERSLAELCAYAPETLLALENRYTISDLPHGAEFRRVFDNVNAPNLRYWHDVGHAHIISRIGFVKHQDMLLSVDDKIVGMHLHDIGGFNDHMPPGEGGFDFSRVADFIEDDTIKVMEIGSSHSARSIKKAKKHLAKAYGIE